MDEIVDNLSLYYGKRIVPGKTLLFFNEIQECVAAWSSLKHFTIDGRYDVIASGSLLGVPLPNNKKGPVEPLIPTGYQEEITMYALDFEELLWANGIDTDLIGRLRQRIRNKDDLLGLPRILE